jgi:hypothetical protein
VSARARAHAAGSSRFTSEAVPASLALAAAARNQHRWLSWWPEADAAAQAALPPPALTIAEPLAQLSSAGGLQAGGRQAQHIVHAALHCDGFNSSVEASERSSPLLTEDSLFGDPVLTAARASGGFGAAAADAAWGQGGGGAAAGVPFVPQGGAAGAAAHAFEEMHAWHRPMLEEVPPPVLLRLAHHHMPGRVALGLAFLSCDVALCARLVRSGVEAAIACPLLRIRYVNAQAR